MIKNVLSIILLVLFITNIQAELTIVNMPYPKGEKPKDLYNDVIIMHNAYSGRGMNYYSDQGTTVHEAVHRLNGGLRHIFLEKSGRILWMFYIGGGKVVQLENPNLTKEDVIKYLPSDLRGNGFDLYMLGGSSYAMIAVVDEWNAYTFECLVSKNLNNQLVYKSCAEFAIYGTAMAMAMKDKDPECWKKSFKDYYIWQVKRSFNLYHNGVGDKRMNYLPYKEFLKGKDSKLRDFMKEQIGEKEYNDLFSSALWRI